MIPAGRLDPEPEEVDRICDHFEAAWKSGERPAIEERLRDLPQGSRHVLFQEFMHLEVQYRKRLGEKPSLDEYLARFPDQGDLIREIFRETMLIATPEVHGGGSPAAATPGPGPSKGSPRTTNGGTPILAPDTRLGRYQIVSLLGKGGMGQVYRAADLRLHREVAVKDLPEELARDLNSLRRFEREARALAALRHRNLLTIHDFGTEHGVSYAVTELLEGETLRARLERSAQSWQEAVKLALAIAEGLAAAHSKGVVHRDLKPENVFLTMDG